MLSTGGTTRSNPGAGRIPHMLLIPHGILPISALYAGSLQHNMLADLRLLHEYHRHHVQLRDYHWQKRRSECPFAFPVLLPTRRLRELRPTNLLWFDITAGLHSTNRLREFTNEQMMCGPHIGHPDC